MFTLGVAPAGVHVARLTAEEREVLLIRCAGKFAKLGSCVITGTAWAAAAASSGTDIDSAHAHGSRFTIDEPVAARWIVPDGLPSPAPHFVSDGVMRTS
jgi:hypothetical protein